jgi:hypothetical protein
MAWMGLLAVLGLSACESAPRQPGVASSGEPSLAVEQQRLRDIIVFNGKPGSGTVGLREIIAAPTFRLLDVEDRFQALTLAAGATTAAEEKLAQGYLDRAIALPGIGFEDLEIIFRMATNAGYAVGATKSLTLLARQWPEQLTQIDKSLIGRALYLIDQVPRDDKMSLLRALYDAHWTFEWGIEPSLYWRDLSILLLDQGLRQEAIDVSAHITAAYVLIAMRADRRFDAVIAAHPERFEVEAAADRETKHYQALSEQHPKSLALKVGLLEALMQQRHYAAMLAESDAVAQDIGSTNFPDKLYDDYVEKHAPYFYLRSIALQRAGRWDEAGVQLAEAAREGEINQLINLASLYWALNRPRDALSVLSTIGPERTSPYGTMQVEIVKLQAAILLGAADQISRSSKYLSEHRADSPADYLVSLLAANQLDLAAAYLVSELQDRKTRQDALLDVQEYLPTPSSELETQLEARWRSVVARKEVQSAIRKVGRIESYPLEAPGY